MPLLTTGPGETEHQVSYEESGGSSFSRVLIINMIASHSTSPSGHAQRSIHFHSPTPDPSPLPSDEEPRGYRKAFPGPDGQPSIWVDFRKDLIRFESYILRCVGAADKKRIVEIGDMMLADRLEDYKRIQTLIVSYDEVKAWFGGPNPKIHGLPVVTTVLVTQDDYFLGGEGTYVWLDTSVDSEDFEWDQQETATALIRVAMGSIRIGFGEIIHSSEAAGFSEDIIWRSVTMADG